MFQIKNNKYTLERCCMAYFKFEHGICELFATPTIDNVGIYIFWIINKILFIFYEFQLDIKKSKEKEV